MYINIDPALCLYQSIAQHLKIHNRSFAMEENQDIQKSSDVGKRCKQLEAQIEPLIQKLESITGYNGSSRYRRRRILERRRSKVKREISKMWKELIHLKQESERNQHKRWCFNEEVENLFSVSLRLSYPDMKDEESSAVFSIREYGEYHCEDVLLVWPRLRKEGNMHLGPRSVGWQIKKNLQLQQSEMIEGEPWVHDIGFVTINISGKWMAKSLHKLLRDGVDTWAPPLFMKNFLVNIYFPSCDIADLTHMDLLRRELIKKTLINILDYCKVGWRSMEPQEELPPEELNNFQILKIDGDVLIFPNAEGEEKPLIRVKGDGCSGDPLEDLKYLWHGLKKERADWIVCLTRVQQQEYIKMCFTAAQHAEWLPSHREDVPRSSYTGYQSCSISIENFVSWFEEAKVSEGYTEEVLKCAVKYTLLKNHRLSDCTFSFEEVLNEEGNTFLYLLKAQARNRSFIEKHRKDMDALKKASQLTLGEGEIWEEGVERVLALHLLQFNQVIAMSCYPVLPHKLCKYLYDLSVRFNSYCDSWEVGIAGKTKLLLCEATEVVMEKCCQLLGITPESSSLGDKWLQESLVSTKSLLQSGRLNHKVSPRKPSPRFELFSVYIHITRDPTLRECKLFGQITISDTYGVLYDGWGLPAGPDLGTVALFDCNWDDQVDVTNHHRLYLGNPSCSKLIPLSSSMEICTELYATTVRNDGLFVLFRRGVEMDFAKFWKKEADTKCAKAALDGLDGDVRMYYILMKDAMDCAIEVTYHFMEGGSREVYAQIYANYGNDFFKKNEDPLVKNFYTTLLYEGHFDSKIAGEVPLKKSMMAVPAKGSIMIKARLFDVDSQAGILDGYCEFIAQPGGSFKKKIDGPCCSLSVSVVWS